MGPTDALWPALTQRLAELKFEDGWHVETPDGTRLDRSATAQLHKRVCVFRNGDEKAAIAWPSKFQPLSCGCGEESSFL